MKLVLTITSVQAEVGARKLDLGTAVIDQPLLSSSAVAIKASSKMDQGSVQLE